MRKLKKEIIEIGKKLWTKGIINSSSGNISVRSGNTIIITPSGKSKGFLKTGELIKLTLEKPLKKTKRKPSIELGFHIAIYKNRPDVNAIVHAHPVYCLLVTENIMSSLKIPEISKIIGKIGFVPPMPPGSEELAKAVGKLCKQHNALVLENHGIITWGKNLEEAWLKTEALCFACECAVLSMMLEKRLHEK